MARFAFFDRVGGVGRVAGLGGVVGFALAAGPALAFDPFGWFGSRSPAPGPAILPYSFDVDVQAGPDGDAKAAARALRDATRLDDLIDDAPPDAQTLIGRAGADRDAMLDALWALGHYDARIVVRVAGVALPESGDSQPARRAAEALRNRERVPVRIEAELGALYRIGRLDLRNRRPEAVLPLRAIDLAPGDPAASAAILAAQARIVDALRDASRPLARADAPAATVRHPDRAVDVSIAFDPGPVAGVGPVAVKGAPGVDPAVIRSFIYLEEGEPYWPKKIVALRKSVAAIPALGSVRIREATTLDARGNLPIFVAVTERKPRLVGVSARYSTIDGPAVHPYFEHRNLFGGAERLRIEGDTFLAPRIDGTTIKKPGDLKVSDIGGRVSLSFEKPALAGSRFDLLAGATALRTRVGARSFGGYTDRTAYGSIGLRYRFSDRISVEAAVRPQYSQTSDVLGQVTGRYVATPASLTYDSTDNPIDATRGFKLSGEATPFFGKPSSFFQARASASAYLALDEEANYVLAGRVGGGVLAGADLADIPARERFFAGGGGSVRGFAFRTLSPMAQGQITGGKSLIEGSLEARIKVTKTIGVVPFIDAGGAFGGSWPDFREPLRVAVGLGLRYYTPIGPIRVDVAAPLNRRSGDKPAALYVGIGQSF